MLSWVQWGQYYVAQMRKIDREMRKNDREMRKKRPANWCKNDRQMRKNDRENYAKESKHNRYLLWILRAVCKLGTNWLENCMNNDGEIFSIKFKPECCQNINAKLWPFKGCLGECWSWGFNLLMGCQPRGLTKSSISSQPIGKPVCRLDSRGRVLTLIGGFNLFQGGRSIGELPRRSGPRGALWSIGFHWKWPVLNELAQKHFKWHLFI